MSVETRALTGSALTQALPDLARLRIEVFRAFPYLYEGSEDYEQGYVRAYAESRDALVVAALDGSRIVGAATAAPMEDHAAEFAAPFEARGLRLPDILYFGESVLLPEYRGRGLGHAFFDAREAHARALGRPLCAFCAVIRPPDHPARPEGYRPHDAFWGKRGYVPEEGLVAEYSWRDIGAAGESAKPMQFWLRATPAA
ncbi:GNAT family N-acetyltransferase [Oceanicella sp. SM1341]|uniref:GNAT family N-acetyltransferase n=1 Tax=Oceanicella sp. SM1341 TaxID=1548889 RepID=UPI001E3BC746|nr:GNAT family N-acetyltransferase [Oceanicella sp. SM1341]